jgi:hypothetical protein
MTTANVVKIDFSDPCKLLEDRVVFDAIRRSRHPACRELIFVMITVAASRGREWPVTKQQADQLARDAIAIAQRNIAKGAGRRRRLDPFIS